MLPNDLPSWEIVYHYCRQWKGQALKRLEQRVLRADTARDGTWKYMNEALHTQLRTACDFAVWNWN